MRITKVYLVLAALFFNACDTPPVNVTVTSTSTGSSNSPTTVTPTTSPAPATPDPTPSPAEPFAVTPTPSPAPTPIPTPAPTPTPSPSPTASPAPTPTPTPSPSPSPTPTPTPSPSPTPTPTPSPSPTPTPAPTAPTVSASSQTIGESFALSFTLNGYSAQNRSLTYSCLSACPTGLTVNASTGVVAWTPGYTTAAIYHPVFGVTDGTLSGSYTSTITVTHTNQAPVLAYLAAQSVNTGAMLTITPTATDLNSMTPTISLVGTPPTNASFSNGVFTFSPSYSQTGQYVITFQATDASGLSSQETVTVTVNYVNAAPVIAQIGTYFTSQGTATQGVAMSFTITATDADGDASALSASNLPSGATFNTSTGVFSWTPACGPTHTGLFNPVFTASDGTLTDQKTANIDVLAASCNEPVFYVGGVSISGTKLTLGFAASPVGYTPTTSGTSYKIAKQFSCYNHAISFTHNLFPTENSVDNYMTITNNIPTTDWTTWDQWFLMSATNIFGQTDYQVIYVSASKFSTNPFTVSLLSAEPLNPGESYLDYVNCGSGTIYQWSY